MNRASGIILGNPSPRPLWKIYLSDTASNSEGKTTSSSSASDTWRFFNWMATFYVNGLYLACIFLLVSLCLYIITAKNATGLASIPGPFLARWSDLWKAYAVYRRDAHKRMVSAHEKYGPVVRIGPNTVSFASSGAMHTIHGSRDAYDKV